MTCGIYKIENIITSEVYIGQSKQIETRWNQHKNSPSGNVQGLIDAYKYDSKLVTFEIVKEIDETIYRPDELNFILDIWEDHMLNLHGGLYGKNVVNAKKISIRPVPLTILQYNLPDFLDRNVLYESIKKYSEDKKHVINVIEDDSKIKRLQNIINTNQYKVDAVTEQYESLIREYKFKIFDLEKKLKNYEDILDNRNGWRILLEENESLRDELSEYKHWDRIDDVQGDYIKHLSIA